MKNPGLNQENCETPAQKESKTKLLKDQNPIPESQRGEKTADIGVFDEKKVKMPEKISNIPRRNQENGENLAQQESKVELRKNLKIGGLNTMPKIEKNDNILAIDEKRRVTVRARRRKNQAGQNQESKSNDIG